MSSLITNVIPSSSSLSPTRFSAGLACNWILLVIWSFRNFWIGQLVLWTKFFYCLSSSRLMPTRTKSFSLFATVLSSATSKNRLSLSYSEPNFFTVYPVLDWCPLVRRAFHFSLPYSVRQPLKTAYLFHLHYCWLWHRALIFEIAKN